MKKREYLTKKNGNEWNLLKEESMNECAHCGCIMSNSEKKEKKMENQTTMICPNCGHETFLVFKEIEI